MPDDIRNGLKPGMSATATITTQVKNNVIAVPLQAIVEKSPTTPAAGASPAPTIAGSVPTATPQGDKPKDIKGVYVLEGNNKVKFIEVVTGITGESDIEILSGVQPGMEIITGPSRVLKALKESQAVKRQTKKAGDGNSNSEGK
ncbi:MAG: hypothetical protein H0X14_03555 [Acidobacteria bacterium]|nr:hypothetical protein [Acidobacteriota bacterium]